MIGQELFCVLDPQDTDVFNDPHTVILADNIMLGQLGEAPMSGATLANNFISIFQICCMGLGMGASVLTSRFWGMKDIVSLKKAINIMYRLMLTIALGFCIATVLVPEGIMGIFTTEEAVILAGTGYLLASICSFFINIFFNWLFIFGSLGALAGLVWHWPGFWIYIMLKIDQFIKAIWCIFRLRWKFRLNGMPFPLATA